MHHNNILKCIYETFLFLKILFRNHILGKEYFHQVGSLINDTNNYQNL